MGAEFGERSWEWGGCDDNINYGYRKSKIFMDTPYEQLSDISTLIKLHNNDAGRLVGFISHFFKTIFLFKIDSSPKNKDFG